VAHWRRQLQVGEEVKFTITAKGDNPCQKEITAQAKPITGDVITAEVKDSQNGSCTAFFVSTQSGEVEVLVWKED